MPHKETAEDLKHIDRILTWVNLELPKKYIAGKREHGGKLWLKRGIPKMMGEEVIDFIVYHVSLVDQLRKYRCPDCGHKLELGEIDE